MLFEFAFAISSSAVRRTARDRVDAWRSTRLDAADERKRTGTDESIVVGSLRTERSSQASEAAAWA
jgi:hypothetical protein